MTTAAFLQNAKNKTIKPYGIACLFDNRTAKHRKQAGSRFRWGECRLSKEDRDSCVYPKKQNEHPQADNWFDRQA